MKGGRGKARYRVQVGERIFLVEVVERKDHYRISVGGIAHEARVLFRQGRRLAVQVGSETLRAWLEGGQGSYKLTVGGWVAQASVEPEWLASIRRPAAQGPVASSIALKAPMPGLVVSVPAAVGQKVKRGDSLVVLQAMKMENLLTAPAAGEVSQVLTAEGQTVDQGQVLVMIQPAATTEPAF